MNQRTAQNLHKAITNVYVLTPHPYDAFTRMWHALLAQSWQSIPYEVFVLGAQRV